VDDNYVIFCPLCNARLSLRGTAGKGLENSPEYVWNQHVDSGDCQRNQGVAKPIPARCQINGCKEQLTKIKSYTCLKCSIITCLEHRYEDAHNCSSKVEVTKTATRFSKLLQPGFFKKKNEPTTAPKPATKNPNVVPEKVERCPMCPAIFRNVDLLIEHSLKEHNENRKDKVEKPIEMKSEVKPKAATDTEKCPECFKRFSVVELPAHMQ